MRRTFTASVLAASFLLPASNCDAANEYIAFGQSASGNALAIIKGDVPFCDFYLSSGFAGPPEASLTVEGVAITSVVLGGGECNPGPPPHPPPVPYQVMVDLGILGDGQYPVNWTYTYPPIANPIMTAHALLAVESGEVAIFRDSFE